MTRPTKEQKRHETESWGIYVINDLRWRMGLGLDSNETTDDMIKIIAWVTSNFAIDNIQIDALMKASNLEWVSLPMGGAKLERKK